MAQRINKDPLVEKQNKKNLLAIIIAAFGFLLFIALALTLPWSK